MRKKIFTLEFPEVIKSIVGIDELTFYSYPVLIFLGSVLAYYFLKNNTKNKEIISFNFILLIVISAYFGGKFFMYFSNPEIELKKLFLGGGFVFYGSFIVSIISVITFLRVKKNFSWLFLDNLVFGVLIVHFFGRLGCFLAGCCYGKPTNFILGVKFPDKDVFVHPTQLYEAFFIGLVFSFLIKIRKIKKFEGQILILYIMLYAVGRFVLEFYRGDERGVFFYGFLSHSQFFAILLFLVSILGYYIFYKSFKKKGLG